MSLNPLDDTDVVDDTDVAASAEEDMADLFSEDDADDADADVFAAELADEDATDEALGDDFGDLGDELAEDSVEASEDTAGDTAAYGVVDVEDSSEDSSTEDVDLFTTKEADADALASDDTIFTADSQTEVDMPEDAHDFADQGTPADDLVEPTADAPDLVEADQVPTEATPSSDIPVSAYDDTIASSPNVSPQIANPEEIPLLATAQVIDTDNVPLVSHGVVLRRYLDLSFVMEAQRALALELGSDATEPTAFVVRAAAKALEQHDLGNTVALAVFAGGGMAVKTISAAKSTSFASLLEQVTSLKAAANGEHDHADLVVADMSTFAIDEAVLNLDAPVLTLGRVVFNKELNKQQSVLALSGDVPAEAGAKLLADIADLLLTPVRLLL